MLECTYDFNAKQELVLVKLNGSIRSDEALDSFGEAIELVSSKIIDYESVVFDFSLVKLINSSGIGKMLIFNKFLADQKKKLYILGLTPALRQLFMFAKIDSSIRSYK